MPGYWTTWGAPASVNWCEPDYAWSPYVAEWWNTWSSLPMCVLGLYGWWWCSRREQTTQRRFAAAYLGIAFVGLGSAAFHGTLLRTAQAADELPMVWLGLVCVWMLAARTWEPRTGGRLALALTVYAALFTIAYLWIASYFVLFVGSYAALVTMMVIGSVRLTWGTSRDMAYMLWASSLTYLGTLAVCWLPEHVFLPCDHPYQALPLHAMWHLGAGYGTYMWIAWAVGDRLRATGVDPAVRSWPLVVVES